jgi:hypothetical protein
MSDQFNELVSLINSLEDPQIKNSLLYWTTDLEDGDDGSSRFGSILEAIKEEMRIDDYISMLPVNQSKVEAENIKKVRKSGLAIRHIKSPSIMVQKLAIAQNPISIKYIKNPSEEIQLYAISNNPSVIGSIDNPTEVSKILAAGKGAFKSIKNPSEEVKMAAVKYNPRVIGDIKDPSETLQLEAVRRDWETTTLISSPSNAVKKASKITKAEEKVENAEKKARRGF